MPRILTRDATILLRGTTAEVQMTIVDDAGDPLDAQEVRLTALASDDTVLFEDTYTDGVGSENGRLDFRGVDTGTYFVTWGDVDPNTETADIGIYTLQWEVTLEAGDGTAEPDIQIVRVISPHVGRMLKSFRMHIDKAEMSWSDDPMRPVTTGYSNAQLLDCLEHGLRLVNLYPPVVQWGQLEGYPDVLGFALLQAATYVGISRQTLFAISTDVDNFGDLQGSYTEVHSPKLAAFLQTLHAWLNERIPVMKLQIAVSTVGTVRTQLNLGGFRLPPFVLMNGGGFGFPTLTGLI